MLKIESPRIGVYKSMKRPIEFGRINKRKMVQKQDDIEKNNKNPRGAYRQH